MSRLEEVWSEVPGYDGFYQISNYGQLATIKKDGRQIRKLNSCTRYLSASLKSLDGGPQKTIYIHQLVASIFIGPRPDGLVIRHLDGNRHNNRVDNLSYGTVEQNYLDVKKHGSVRKEKNGRALLTERSVNAIRLLHSSIGVSKKDLARAFDVSDSTIDAVIKQRNWKTD